jgi:hypothetical protein
MTSYKERLHPWCIVRQQSGMQPEVLQRFRRRNDAEHHLQAVRRLPRSGTLTIVFDGKETLGAEAPAVATVATTTSA